MVAVAALGQDLRGEPAGVAGSVPEARADYTLSLDQSPNGRLVFESPQRGLATLLVLGLQCGGAVRVLVNGSPAASVELLAHGETAAAGPVALQAGRHGASARACGKADSAWIRAVLESGRNELEICEDEGLQAVRVAGSQCWFVTSAQAAGKPMFWIDFEALTESDTELAAHIHYGPTWEHFLWISGRWGEHSGGPYAERVVDVRGSSGTDAATLSYTVEDSRLRLLMPTRMTFESDPETGAFTIRVRQTLRATGETVCGDDLEFLQVRIAEDRKRDWGDGLADYAWYRYQGEDCPDAPRAGRTGMIRIVEPPRRTLALRASATRQPEAEETGGEEATALALGATNTLGGYFAKTGVGSCGWVFHHYGTNVREELTPLYTRSGPGAGTHFHVSWPGLVAPLALRVGDWVEAEYSLAMLPCEVRREEIEDLNEADLLFFGAEQSQAVPVTGWIGTQGAIGLVRGDGSVILLGLGRAPVQVPLPASTVVCAVSAYRLFDVGRPAFEFLDLDQGTVAVRPGWITVVDCGAALLEPITMLQSPTYGTPRVPLGAEATGEDEAKAAVWPPSAVEGALDGMLWQK
jgi:hypothetical protein